MTLDNDVDVGCAVIALVIGLINELFEWHEDRHVNDGDDLPSRNAGKTLFRENP